MFNLADSAIVCAGVLVVLIALRGIRLDGTRAVADADSTGGSGPRHPEPPESQRQ